MPYADAEKRRIHDRRRWKTHGHISRERSRLKRQRDVASAVFTDAVHADRKFGREYDIDLEFVRNTISNPCSYCGETKLRMTLDRVDNSKGHLKSNVLPACERCNFIRRDMPFDAWVVVSAGVKKANDLGLFGSWTCSIYSKRRGSVDP